MPAIWDRTTGRIVTNDYPFITVQMHTAFAGFATSGVDLYPEALRDEIHDLDELIFHNVNNGVYKAGFATTQAAYERAFDALFATLDQLEDRLSEQRFLVGDQLTEADIRLFTTLVRFDAVYYAHFKCNLRRLVDYPHLWAYARDLYQRDGFHDTTNFDHIKRHYFGTHERLNPTRIVPKGPEIDWWVPHGRDSITRSG